MEEQGLADKVRRHFPAKQQDLALSEEMWKSLKQVLPGSKDISKIVEHAVHSQLYGYLTTNNLLYIKQSGFRRKRSTASALLKVRDEILNNMDQGEVMGAVFLDLKKAFDTVNHRILLLKLQSLGVDVLSIPWFKSYLENRGCQTSIGNSISSKRTMNIGVLGPLLFLVYVNDFADVLKNCQASLFADDTAIYCSSQTALDLEAKLNEDLNYVKDWLNKHRLTLNIKSQS
ncbi:putative RNA-directed DNA polymerase from transposon BS [Stylophora pistillata]|uniref:Putative RNA-directed DNA polymerase from transposon BS n=1 Tax=Stylophora pistillata TaxID=50429 RepID=A0A2B4RA12_STYPI|nr:putative RNA-directed DNA polymerase from transposon BS [Stylophora pistillata]